MKHPELIVMLTKNDHTVENACEVFEACADSAAQCWGAKEIGLPPAQLKNLYAAFKDYGKTSFLEVVAYDETACMDGAKLAAECGCHVLLGTLFYDSVNQFCKDHGLQYMPFIGKVSGRPSVLDGTAEEMLAQLEEYLCKGVCGADLLGYRHRGDGYRVSKEVVTQASCPICLAGSIDSYERLDQVLSAAPAWFTIGGAFFDGKFGGDFRTQINRVCEYICGAVPSL